MDKLLQEIIELYNTLPPLIEYAKPKPLYTRALTTRQKRKESAIKACESRLLVLHNSLIQLQNAKRISYNNEISRAYSKRIKDLRQKINTTNRYIKGHKKLAPTQYRPGNYPIPKDKSDAWYFIKELFLHEYIQWKKFETVFEEQIQYYKESQFNNLTAISKNAKAKARYLWRIHWVLSAILEGNAIHLEPLDAKWIIKHMENVAKRLERDRAVNYTLPKEIAEHLQNDDYRKEKQGHQHHHKYGTYELAEIASPRPVQRLMESFGCQLREDERDTLIRIALEWRDKFTEFFT